jgi:hypothetical protein
VLVTGFINTAENMALNSIDSDAYDNWHITPNISKVYSIKGCTSKVE